MVGFNLTRVSYQRRKKKPVLNGSRRASFETDDILAVSSAASVETSTSAYRAGEAATESRTHSRTGKSACESSISRHLSPVARTEVVEIRAAISESVERSVSDNPRRIEAPAKRTPEQSVSRNPRIGAEIGIPIPSGAIPTVASRVRTSCIHVCLGQVGGPKASPAIKVVLGGFLVKAASFELVARVERQLMPACHAVVSIVDGHFQLAVKHADQAAVRVEIVESFLLQPDAGAVFIHHDVIGGKNFPSLYHRASALHRERGIFERRRIHPDRRVAINSQEHAWSKQNFRFAILSRQRLTSLQASRADRILIQRLRID